MSVDATSRAWKSGASGNELLVLLALADFAGGGGDPYDFAYPAVETIEQMTRVSRRTVQRCLRALEEQGYVTVTGEHNWGRGKVTTQYRIEAGGSDKTTGRQDDAASPDVAGGASPVTPNPPKDPPTQKKSQAGAQEDAFPEDLPSSMHEVAIAAGKILKRTAETRGQKKPVTRAAVGQAILTYPDRDFVQVAREVENWLLHGRGARKSCADIVQRYGNFLKNSDMVAGPPLPQGVTPLHGRPSGGGRPSASDLLREIGARHVDRG